MASKPSGRARVADQPAQPALDPAEQLRRSRDTMKKVAAANKRAKAAGDPLNLTRHTKVSPTLLKVRARRRRKEAKARYVVIVLDGNQKVTFDLKTNPVAGIYRNGGISGPQFGAAAWFERDCDTAENRIKSPSLEPAVDGGRTAGANMTAVEARSRLMAIRERIGEESMAIMRLVIHGRVTLTDLELEVGYHKKAVSHILKDALDKTATFYGLQKSEPEHRLRQLRTMLHIMAKAAGEHVL